jgi:hypothetical protein
MDASTGADYDLDSSLIFYDGKYYLIVFDAPRTLFKYAFGICR